MADIYDLIEIEDLSDCTDLELIAEICGIDVIRSLMRSYSGCAFYVPSISRLDQFCLNYYRSRIVDCTAKKICGELGVSEHYLRAVVRKSRAKINLTTP